VILLVEHDAALRDPIIDLLRREGYLVLAVDDGALAIDVVRHNPISLIILDPPFSQNGLDLCRQLRASSETAQVPILMMVTSEAEIAQLVRLGPHVNDYIVKPFLWEELQACVRALLRGGKRRVQKGILVVEHDAAWRDTIAHRLQGEGYLVLAATNEGMAMDVAQHHPISLVILDSASLQSGLDLCCQLRASSETAQVPILMMVTSDIEIAQLVRLGPRVNDYIVKPFLWEELQACVRALLRSGKRRIRQKLANASPSPEKAHEQGQILVADTLCIDVAQHRVTRGDQQIKLGNNLLFNLLVYLVRHRGVALTRDQLLRYVWGSEPAKDSRTVDVHVHWLRQKLQDDPDHPQLIQTVPGVGYRFKG
jgi:two-component system, OmpR family, alkaline phosphatase synthesis response regulator PhoP